MNQCAIYLFIYSITCFEIQFPHVPLDVSWIPNLGSKVSSTGASYFTTVKKKKKTKMNS